MLGGQNHSESSRDKFSDNNSNTNLWAVRLSQKVMVPSVPRVSTQQCGVPLALVPTHT